MFRRREPLDQLRPRRICLIKPSALGDVVHALPVLTGLRRRFPDAHITWVVNRSYEPLLKGHPDLTDTLAFDRSALRKNGFRASLASFGRFLTELRRRDFDLVLDLQGLFRSGLMTLATRAPRRVGLPGAREGASWFYTDVVPGPARADGHAVDRYWSAARALGASDADRVFRLPPLADDGWVDQALAACPRPWIAAAVGSRWQTKRWPPAHFAELLGRAARHFGGSIQFVGGPEDTPAAVETSSSLPCPHLLLTGRTTLPQLAALLVRADVMVGNDTGPLHLACALGRPVVAPYTCTRVALTGPYGQLSRGVQTEVPCGGSLLKKCPKMVCMDELTPDRLWPTLREVLSQWHSNSRSA
jgi:lipopolysaccharide heptosyltransferase I